MKTFTLNQFLTMFAATCVTCSCFAQEKSKFEITPAADIVSSYVWRGVYQTSTSVQPSVKASYAGLSLTAWGSTDLTPQPRNSTLRWGTQQEGSRWLSPITGGPAKETNTEIIQRITFLKEQ